MNIEYPITNERVFNFKFTINLFIDDKIIKSQSVIQLIARGRFINKIYTINIVIDTRCDVDRAVTGTHNVFIYRTLRFLLRNSRPYFTLTANVFHDFLQEF